MRVSILPSDVLLCAHCCSLSAKFHRCFCATRVQGPEPEAGAQDEGALAALLLGLGRSAWLAGFVVVPATFFWAGVAAWDPLHGAYLLLAAAPTLWQTLQLQPQVGSTPSVRWAV